MKSVNRNQLLEYLRYAIKLESSIETQTNIIKKYEDDTLWHKPTLELLELPQYPTMPTKQYAEVTEKGANVLSILIGIVGIIASLFMMLRGFSDFEDGSGLAFTGILILAGAIYFFYTGVKDSNSGSAAKKELQKKLDEAYAKEMEKYTREKNKYDATYNNIRKTNEEKKRSFPANLAAWEESRAKALVYLKKHLSETKRALTSFYEVDVIYSKYRNLAALSSIYEYIESGRCTDLTGPNGAYNLYEDELRKNIVIAQLNVVISKLEQIRSTQYMLYQEVKQIQNNTSKMVGELTRIRQYAYELKQFAAINTYYNGIIAANTSALAFCRTL